MTATKLISKSYDKFVSLSNGYNIIAKEYGTQKLYSARNDELQMIVNASLDTSSNMLSFDSMAFTGEAIARSDYKLTRHQLYYFDKLLSGEIAQ